MDIGREIRTYTVEPLFDPLPADVPRERPAPQRDVPVPA